MFQVKSFLSIAASMINRMRSTTTKINDYNVGSVARTLVEAPAQEIDELYQQMLAGLLEAIPTSVYNSFNFGQLQATPAVGTVRVVVTASSSSIPIPTGATFNQVNGPGVYNSVSDVTIAASATYVDVPVAAASSGVSGNLPIGATFTMGTPPSSFVSASNLVPIQGGTETETAAQWKLRFNAYIATLARGTVAALTYGLQQQTFLTDAFGNITERVVFSAVIEPYLTDITQPIALVNCYIHNGVGSTSTGLVDRAVQVLYGYYDANGNAVPGWKAAGVNVTVAAATETSVNVTATHTTASGYSPTATATAIQSAIYSYIIGLGIGAPALLAEMIALAMAVPGVSNIAISAPGADVTPGTGAKLMPGTIAIT